jgi:hypothetical protein
MMYKLRRERDGAGDSGEFSTAVWVEENEVKFAHDARPVVGVVMRVGSLYARSFQYQDWWQTTRVEEILEESENYVRFRTTNSIYEWWQE